jgi:hypothetical protein
MCIAAPRQPAKSHRGSFVTENDRRTLWPPLSYPTENRGVLPLYQESRRTSAILVLLQSRHCSHVPDIAMMYL